MHYNLKNLQNGIAWVKQVRVQQAVRAMQRNPLTCCWEMFETTPLTTLETTYSEVKLVKSYMRIFLISETMVLLNFGCKTV